MKFIAIAIIFVLAPSIGQCKRGNDIEYETEIARKADEQLNNNPALTPEEATHLREEKARAVDKIETIANAEPKDTATQLQVGKSLASVSEAPRAVPYAERGLKLAESSGDPKLVREALLTGSEVYYKAGNYDLARARAQRILKDNPKDKDAMALYMQVKDRGTTSSAAPRTGSAGGGAGAAAGQQYAGGAAATAAEAPRGPGVAMTSASSLEAQKQIALGWSRMKLDPTEALKNFEAAVAADPKGAATRAARSKARLTAGDASGALQDANDAISLHSGFAGGYAARAEANRALGKSEIELLADYETAAKLDGNFTEAYKTVLARSGTAGATSENTTKGNGNSAGASVPSGPMSLLHRSPKSWGLIALIVALLAAAGAVAATGALKRRRSDEDDSLPR